MVADRNSSSRPHHHDRVRLRASVLRIGGMLGWEPHDIIAFTEGITNCSWRRCGCDEFQTVLEEYLAMGRAIQQKVARHRVREQGAIFLEGEERDNAAAG